MFRDPNDLATDTLPYLVAPLEGLAQGTFGVDGGILEQRHGF